MKYTNMIRAGLNLLHIVLIWSCVLVLPLLHGIIVYAIACVQKRNIPFKEYFVNNLLTQDQTVNAILLGNVDHSLSGRIGYLALKGDEVAYYMSVVVDYIFIKLTGEEDHCLNSVEQNVVKGKNYVAQPFLF